MKKPTFSRRDVLKARPPSRRARVRPPGSCRPRRRRPRSRPQLIEAAKKEGKVVYYTSIDLPIAETDRQGVRGEVSRHRRAGRAHRRRARVPAHRPGICEPHPRGRRRSTRRTPRISSSGSARAFSQPFVPEDVAKHYPAEHQDPGRACSRASASGSASSATTPIW